MEGVDVVIVGGQGVLVAVEGEVAVGDAVSVASDDRAHVGAVVGEVAGFIAVHGGVAEDHVADFAGAVGGFDGGDVGSPGDDFDFEGLVLEGVGVDGSAVGGFAEVGLGDGGLGTAKPAEVRTVRAIRSFADVMNSS